MMGQDGPVESRLNDADYQLRWPRWLFVREASRLLNNRDRRHWDGVCEQFLEDAFIGGVNGGPLSEFRDIQLADFGDPWGPAAKAAARTANLLSEKQKFLRQLMHSAERRLYASQTLLVAA
jgi:hypothetical protein